MTKQTKRGDIYYADLDPVIGSEQNGFRPVLIIQNNTGNRRSPTVVVAAITSKPKKAAMPTHYPLPPGSGLESSENARSNWICRTMRKRNTYMVRLCRL